MSENNGKFLKNLIQYVIWAFALVSFGWTAATVFGSKAEVSELTALIDKVNAAVTTNALQDAAIDTINKNLTDINGKLDKLLWYKK